MVTINKNKHELTLKAINKTNNNNVVKKHGKYTKIYEEKTYYLFLEDKNNLRELEEILKSTFTNICEDINVDTNSFFDIFKDDQEKIVQLIVESAMYANHTRFTLKQQKKVKNKINILCDDKFKNLVNNSEIKMEFLNFARDLQDTPPNVGTSVWLADQIVKKAKDIPNLKVTVLNKKQVQELKMGLLLSVNSGSRDEPRVVIMEYCSDPKLPKTALIGKGITYDSGGYNLKPTTALLGMKFDMTGGAVVSSTVMAIAKAKLKANVCSVALFTDNAIGAAGTLPESVITSMNGLTVEIGNTDAEGRLVLADGITYAVRNLKADRLVDVATLTGAISICLGKWWSGAFSFNDEFFNNVQNAANNAQEYIWRMPVIPEFYEFLKEKTKVADLNNFTRDPKASSCVAACFLDIFAEGKPFVHLDIAGTADDDLMGKAPMLKTLFELNNN